MEAQLLKFTSQERKKERKGERVTWGYVGGIPLSSVSIYEQLKADQTISSGKIFHQDKLCFGLG
eukprot:snap_masked-scaffold_6-processed-gene-2.11-mRNA-1 protein AED:1.00 eAED:1.00 QI:0/0/0/0/1/1/3/0/63